MSRRRTDSEIQLLGTKRHFEIGRLIGRSDKAVWAKGMPRASRRRSPSFAIGRTRKTRLSVPTRLPRPRGNWIVRSWPSGFAPENLGSPHIPKTTRNWFRLPEFVRLRGVRLSNVDSFQFKDFNGPTRWDHCVAVAALAVHGSCVKRTGAIALQEIAAENGRKRVFLAAETECWYRSGKPLDMV